MELCLVTDQPKFALQAESAGVERIMVDLEHSGKLQRQAGTNSFISPHTISAVSRMRDVLSSARLVVRIDSLNDNSCEQINEVIAAGADFIMLPYFHQVSEVRTFLSLVNGRAKTVLLVETKSAVDMVPQLLTEKLGDEVHIGLNDLHISLGYPTIYEPICNGLIESLASRLRNAAVPFGFGGIARLSHRELPVDPHRVLAEQVRLGASIGWLGRSFREDIESKPQWLELAREVALIRHEIEKWQSAGKAALESNRIQMIKEIKEWGATLEAHQKSS